MTLTSYTVIFGLCFLFVLIGIQLYKIFRKKKQWNWKPFLGLLFYVLFFIIPQWNAQYYGNIAAWEREKLNIPALEENMKLRKRSRYKEIWENTDTSVIRHATKVIHLRKGIEKELDYYINQKERRTLKIESKFLLFSEKINEKYYLMTGIYGEEKIFHLHKTSVEISKYQKDSVLQKWDLFVQK